MTFTVLFLASAGTSADEAARKAGKIPLDFPLVATQAKINEYVLAPSYQFIDKVFLKGAAKASMIFYGATVVDTGKVSSRVRTLAGTEATIPNSLIVPLKHGATAKKGDVVLTWWQSGSGIQRGYVVSAKDPQRPVVRYTDIKLDNPAKNNGVPLGELEEELKPSSFVKLAEQWLPGTTVAAGM